MRRVVVTGMGAITPIGNSVDEFWQGIKAGKVGIDEITKFDTTDYSVKLAAEVKDFVAKERMEFKAAKSSVKLAAEVKDFVAKERMEFKAAKRMSPFSQYAVCAAKEALEQSGLDLTKEDPYKVGVSVGSGIGGMKDMEEENKKLLERGPGRIKPLLVPMMITNMAAELNHCLCQ
ncbi:hypothetical protein DXA21_22700 [Parabacteroides distasonis]|nr:hypothetical protein DXA21_22700 [Parabacteroides distasonis]